MHSVGGLWVIGFDIADVLFVPGVYSSTGLSYILLVTCVTFQAVNTFCWLYGLLDSCFCIVLVVLKAIFILEFLNRFVIFLTAGPKKVKGTHFWFGSVAIGPSVCFFFGSVFLLGYV